MKNTMRLFWGLLIAVFLFGFAAPVAGALGHLAALKAFNALSIVAVLAFWVVFGAIFWRTLGAPAQEMKRLLKVGEEASATVQSIRETGSSLKLGGSVSKPGIQVHLEIHPRSRPSYNATVTTFMSVFDLQKVQPGQTVNVKFDPEKPASVMIVDVTQPFERFDSKTTH